MAPAPVPRSLHHGLHPSPPQDRLPSRPLNLRLPIAPQANQVRADQAQASRASVSPVSVNPHPEAAVDASLLPSRLSHRSHLRFPSPQPLARILAIVRKLGLRFRRHGPVRRPFPKRAHRFQTSAPAEVTLDSIHQTDLRHSPQPAPLFPNDLPRCPARFHPCPTGRQPCPARSHPCPTDRRRCPASCHLDQIVQALCRLIVSPASAIVRSFQILLADHPAQSAPIGPTAGKTTTTTSRTSPITGIQTTRPSSTTSRSTGTNNGIVLTPIGMNPAGIATGALQPIVHGTAMFGATVGTVVTKYGTARLPTITTILSLTFTGGAVAGGTPARLPTLTHPGGGGVPSCGVQSAFSSAKPSPPSQSSMTRALPSFMKVTQSTSMASRQGAPLLTGQKRLLWPILM